MPAWQDTIVTQLRLPRAVAGFAVGAMLGMAGTLMQVLLRNPLAEPYVLGISGGAAAAALGSIMLGLGSLWVSSSAFAGSLLSMFLVFLLGRSRQGSERLLLTGVVLAAGWGAPISFLLATGPDQSLRGMLFWLMGDLSRITSPWWSVPVVALALAAGWVMAPALDVLAQGISRRPYWGWRSIACARLLCHRLAADRLCGDPGRAQSASWVWWCRISCACCSVPVTAFYCRPPCWLAASC